MVTCINFHVNLLVFCVGITVTAWDVRVGVGWGGVVVCIWTARSGSLCPLKLWVLLKWLV